MHLSALSLVDFRSYESVEIDLARGGTTFLGGNGVGKTNLLEAMAYPATLGSHRVAADAPLVRQGAERAVVRTTVVRDGRAVLVEIEIVPGRANRARINRAPVPRPREVLGLLRAVLFAPEDLAVVKGDPAERRRFLDELLVARAPRYSAVRADYDRVLKQRGTLLKSSALARRSGRGRAGGDPELATLDVWDAHLARHGGELLAARLRLVELLAPLVDKSYAEVSDGRGPVRLEYRASVPGVGEGGAAPGHSAAALAAALLAELQRLRPQELDRGLTLAGPHRDDLVLSVGSLPARGYASQGESWSVALALRLASYELLREGDLGGGEPVLMLDDVFAELDEGRRDRLATLVAPAEQVLVTAAVADDVPAVLRDRVFHVERGAVRAG